MKVIQIIPKMDIGGVERGVIDLISYFRKKDIKNIIISGGGRLLDRLKEEGTGHYKVPVQRKSLLSVFLIPKLRRIINKENADIIHARSRVPAWLSFFASRRSSAHFITTAHGVYKSLWGSEVMGWGKFVICPSKAVARNMHKRFGVPEDKIVIINRWVDLNRFRFTDYDRRRNSNVIVSVGRISPSKGYEYLIEGFRRVVRANPYLVCKIVGSADKSKAAYLNYLKTLVNRFSLNYNIQFLGFQENVENILAQARILIAPSVIEESFGRVIIEAFACGVPVIATRVGAFNEIIEDGRDGILVDSKEPRAIAESVLNLLDNHTLAKRIVKAAREKVDSLYTMEKSLERTAEVYKKTLSSLRILVIKISSLGDLILSLPSLKSIRRNFPEGKIYLLTLKKYSSLLYDCPYIDKIITVNKEYKKLKNVISLAKDLRRKSFDYIVDLQNNYASHIISFLSLPRYSFGYSLRGGRLLTNKIKCKCSDDPLTSQGRVLSLLGVNLKEKKLILWKERGRCSISLPAGELIGINVSASSKWTSKNWPLRNIVRLIEIICKDLPSAKVILLGAGDAKERAEEIESALKLRLFNLCGKISLKDLPSLIRKLRVFITPDTATLHLAQACGVPVIALFGPTNPLRHTVTSKHLYIFCKELSCSFCYHSRCRQKQRNACLEKITPQEVFRQIKEILKVKDRIRNYKS